ARHHLVQYLGWEVWQREDLLTARAYAPELEAMSLRVLAEGSAESNLRERPPSRAVPTAVRARARLAALAGFVQGAPPARTRWRRFAIAGAVVVGVGVATVAVVDAVRYHATYSSRQKSESREKPDGKI